MPQIRKLWKILPAVLVCVLIWCILFQESFLLDQTEVRQEIVYKLNALEQEQKGSDFDIAKSAAAAQKKIIDELMEKSVAKKPSKSKTTDVTRTWFQRQNPAQSKRPVEDHPLFPGYIIENPDVCGDLPVDILIYIHSAVENAGRRNVIRETWGGTKLFHDIVVKTVFILGYPTSMPDQNYILNEYAAHGDIIQGQFLDTFRNLTMKAVTLLMWVNWHCPQAKYLLKADDDYFVDTFGIVEDFLPRLAQRKTTFECRYSKNFQIIRNTNKKWHIESHIVEKRTHWPPFCSGFFVLFTGDVIPLLYENSFNISEYVAVDDAYLFGLLTEGNPNITFVNIHDIISVNTRPNPEEEITSFEKFEFSVFEVELPETTHMLWKLRLKRLSEWAQAHSLYVKLFESPGKKTVIV